MIDALREPEDLKKYPQWYAQRKKFPDEQQILFIKTEGSNLRYLLREIESAGQRDQ